MRARQDKRPTLLLICLLVIAAGLLVGVVTRAVAALAHGGGGSPYPALPGGTLVHDDHVVLCGPFLLHTQEVPHGP